MDSSKKRFLQAIKASLENRSVDWDGELPPESWLALFRLAQMHHVLPMIYEAVYSCPAAQKADKQIFLPFQHLTKQAVVLQTIKTSEFLELLTALQAAGAAPIVVKGIVCRALYPNPDARMSSDEDVWIPPEQYPLCHKVLCEFGMQPSGPVQPGAYEVPYEKSGSPLSVELHKHLFPPDSDAYGDLNRFFEGVRGRAVTEVIQGVAVPTMNETDHLMYLIFHSFKHFLHSGFGIRQVCDICLYANAHGSKVNWQRILNCCRSVHGEYFAAALFRIGEKYLTFDPNRACYPDSWRKIPVEEGPMLEDILDSGIYGGGSMSRKHSSSMTLSAVAAQKQGRRAGKGVLGALFPPASGLTGRYPYLKEKPYLLPVAWTDRILKYRRETAAGSHGNSPAASIKIGNKRLALLRKYSIIK